VEAILDAPVATDRMSECGSISLDAEDVVAHLGGNLLADTSVVLYHTDAAKSLPIPVRIQGGDEVLIFNNPRVSVLSTPMVFVGHLNLLMRNVRKVLLMGLCEKVFHLLIE
jgi:hypothetical protein